MGYQEWPLRLRFNQGIFLLTGVLMTLMYQLLAYMGAGDETTGITLMFKYWGLAAVVLMPAPLLGAAMQPAQAAPNLGDGLTPVPSNSKRGDLLWLFFLALLELLGDIAGLMGIALAGSGLYQVVYSTGVLFNACFSWALLDRRLSKIQWVAVAVATGGLMVSAVGAPSHAVPATLSAAEATDDVVAASVVEDESDMSIVHGVAATLVSTLVFSLYYVLGELVLRRPGMSPYKMQSYCGLINGTLLTLYVAVRTVPQWDSLVVQPIFQAEASPSLVLGCLLVLLLAANAHAVTHFLLLKQVGAVDTAVIQSLRALLVFGLSASLFCGTHASQCFTPAKGLATVLVLAGVSLYAYSPRSSVRILGVQAALEK